MREGSAAGPIMFDAATYKCPGMAAFSINLLLPEGSSYWLGLARATIFSLFVLYNIRQTSKASRNDVDAAKAMILPMLAKLIYAYILLNLVVAIVGIATYDDGCENRFKGVFLAMQMGAFHTLLEGLAFYLMRYGTGWRAVRDSLICGLIWGAFTFIVYFVQMTLFCGTYSLVGLPIERAIKRQMWLGVSCGYNSMLLLFYLTFLVVPMNWLYRRPALRLYSQFQTIYQLFWIITSVLVYEKTDNSPTVCVLSAFAIVLMVFVHPVITYYALQLDSQYWQGLVPDEGNPLADVWGSVGVATATSMARGVAELEKTRTVQMLHFGLLDLDSKLGFVPGGFSRVYFGTLRGKEHVAVKVIYSIELSPHEIAHFCREAKILDKLRHENIVHCHGVCVMPPALALVFENCKYGSLFNFLYVAKFAELPDSDGTEHDKPKQPLLALMGALTGTHHRDHSRDTGPGTVSPLSFGGAPDQRVTSTDLRVTSVTPGHGTHCVLLPNVEPALPHSPSSNLLKLSSVIPQPRGQAKREAGPPRDHIPPMAASAPSSSSAFDQLELGHDATNGWSNIPSPSLPRSLTVNSEIEMSQSFSHGATLSTSPLHSHLLAATLSFEDRVSLMLDAASAIAFMHSRGYLHCDIKSLNFLVCDAPEDAPPPPPSSWSPSSPTSKPRSPSSPNLSPTSSPATSGKFPPRSAGERGGCKFMLKLADMGEARTRKELEAMAAPPVPSRNWAPPEVLVAGATALAYTDSSDVFGLALVLSEVSATLGCRALPPRLRKKYLPSLLSSLIVLFYSPAFVSFPPPSRLCCSRCPLATPPTPSRSRSGWLACRTRPSAPPCRPRCTRSSARC